MSPTLLAYLMGPLALVTLLVLMHFRAIAQEPPWLWIGVFIAIPSFSLLADRIYARGPSRLNLNFRVAVQVAAVSMVIYLTGWGPVLTGAYAFLALENVPSAGSRAWRVTAVWSLLGIAAGQVAISLGWAASNSPSPPPTRWPPWAPSSSSSSSVWPGPP